MKALFTLTLPAFAVIMAGMSPRSTTAQIPVTDVAGLAESVLQTLELIEQVKIMTDQLNLQQSIRDAADSHLFDFRQSLESRLVFDVDRYLDRHLSDIEQFNNTSHVNPDVISSKTLSEAEFVEYFNYHAPARLDSYDPEEHERMLFTSINERMNEIRDARIRLTRTADEIAALSDKARTASTPEERKQIQMEAEILQAKQESEQQMIEISRADLETLMEMDSHAEATRQRKEADRSFQRLIAVGSLSDAELERRMKDVEEGLKTKGDDPKQIRLRPTFRKNQ